MLHSGARNIGKEIAERHIYAAKGLEHNLGLLDRDLAVFLAGTAEMDAYLHDLYWAQDYAKLNRRIMMATVKGVFARFFPEVVWGQEVNAHHNYVARETYDGVDLVVTRKGAISAKSDEFGLIPGSMGTGSYVVRRPSSGSIGPKRWSAGSTGSMPVAGSPRNWLPSGSVSQMRNWPSAER
jgi:tRNA-splicing ligase RtcB